MTRQERFGPADRDERFDAEARAQRFGRAVDRLLDEAGRGSDEQPDVEDARDLAFAAELAGIDFSGESAGRLPLRTRLVSAGSKSVPRKRGFRVGNVRIPRPLAAASVALALLGVLVVVQPGLLASAMQPAIRVIKQVVLGGGSEVRLIARPSQAVIDSSRAMGARNKEAGKMWVVWTGLENMGGYLEPGQQPYVRLYNSLHLAKAAVATQAREPGWLPEGYQFLNAMVGPDDTLVLIYIKPGKDRVSIIERPVALGGVGDDEGSLKDTIVSGHKAAWLNRGLYWDDAQMSYSINSRKLDLKTTTRIAESLR